MLGTSLIAISFFLIIGPPIAAGIFLRLTRFVSEPPREFWRTLGTTLLASFTVQVVGLIIALYVVWHIEAMFRRRAAGEGSEAAEPTQVKAAG